MDISNWGWGQLLELPDHLFGRRHVVGCFSTITGGVTVFDISETALPEKAVIWEVNIHTTGPSSSIGSVSLALGDHLPVADAEFNAFEQLLPDVGFVAGTRRDIYVCDTCCFALKNIKVGISSTGRRLVMRYNQIVGETYLARVELVVSSVPRSLPEWFV